MDWGFVFDTIYEFSYLLAVFGLLSVFVFARGRQAMINLTVGLYLALLILLEFPYLANVLGSFSSSSGQAIAQLSLYGIITILTTWLCYRIMPDEFDEERFESAGKKLLLAGGATVLVLAVSFNIVPITELLAADTPIQSLFSGDELFFWWMLLPLAIMFFV
jgi:hypothetical protein